MIAPRLTLPLTGALAGLCFWLLSEGARQDWLPDRTMLGLVALVLAAFSLLLALGGPLALRRVAPAAALAGLAFGGTFWWAAGRHNAPERFLELGYGPMAWAMALLIVTPLIGAALAGGRDGWRDYERLFALSWQIVVRFVSAAFFAALFWGLVSLSDALLRIVGLRLLDLLTEQEAVVWVLSGAVFGLALAVVDELSDLLSPDLPLRLLRLFVPPVLAVALVFLGLLPLRGWDGLLGGYSPAAILVAFAIAAIVLVTVALERDTARAVQGPGMRAAVQGLAVLVPVLAGLALSAVWLRMGQYGWTPARLVAATLAAVALVYGLAYAGGVALRGDWAARIRASNIWLALGSVAVCATWLTLVHPERIAARSQLARAMTGLPAEDLPLRALAQDWGHAGQDALARLEAARPDLSEVIAKARAPLEEVLFAEAGDLAARVPVYPAGATLPEGAWDALPEFYRAEIARDCANAIPEGPGCALFLGGFETGAAPLAVLFRRRAADLVEYQGLVLRDGRLDFAGGVLDLGPAPPLPLPGIDDAALATLHRGEGRLEPVVRNGLQIDGRMLFPHN